MKNPFQRGENGGGSFLPQEYVERKAEMRANLLCLSLFGVVMFGVVGAFFVTNRQWLTVKRSREAIASQYALEAARIEQLKLLEKQRAEIVQRAEVSNSLIEHVRRSVLLGELANRKPDEITLLEVQLIGKRIVDKPKDPAPVTPAATQQTKNLSAKSGNVAMIHVPQGKPDAAEKVAPPRFDHTIKLTGVAKSNTNIADYLASLKACPLLDNVDLKYIKETTIEKLELRKFELEAAIRRDADTGGMEVATGKTPEGMPGSDPTRMRSGVQAKPSITVVQPKGEE
jgi:Tfp pilus assembly protein PilN